MSVGRWVSLGFGFAALLGGLLLLAFSQVSAILPEGGSGIQDLREGGVVSEEGGVVLSALLVTLGALVLLGRASRAPAIPKTGAMALIAAALPLFLIAQTTLVINGAAVGEASNRWMYFSASYFFHTGGALSFAAVYILFVFTLTLVYLILGATGYLLAPDRFGQALFDRRSWAKNEALHIAATLFLLLSLTVLLVYFLWLAGETSPADLQGQGLLADLLLPMYYLVAVLLFAVILTVAAHAFLLNWGSQAPGDLRGLVRSVANIARVERGLLGAAAALNAVILLAPSLPSRLELSTSFAFDVSPRGLSFAFYLLLVPFVPYAVTTRRLDALLRAGRAPAGKALFEERSLRLVLVHMSGLILLTALGVAARWDPLGVMLAFTAWTGGVLLYHAVRLEPGEGLPRVRFRDASGPPLYFVFLGLALTAGLLLWGAGNTFEVAYLPSEDTLQVVNESGYGVDVFARVAAAVVLAGTLVLTMDLWLSAYGIDRRFLAHYLGIFVTSTLAALMAFSVGVWTAGSAGIQDAYAGFAFRQYYALEETGVGLFLTAAVGYVFYAVGRILGPAVRAGMAGSRRASPVRWR